LSLFFVSWLRRLIFKGLSRKSIDIELYFRFIQISKYGFPEIRPDQIELIL